MAIPLAEIGGAVGTTISLAVKYASREPRFIITYPHADDPIVNDRLILPRGDRLKLPTPVMSHASDGGVRVDRTRPAFRFSRSR